MRFLGVLVAIAAIGTPAAAGATVYRWVDASGVVNYGNQRPAEHKHATRLDEASSGVSTVPGPSAEELARQRTFLLEARVARLERELAEPRRAADTVVMIGQPAPPLVVGTGPWLGWWGAPVVRTRGWHVRPFPPHSRPPLMRPQPLPQPISAPMRFQNPRAAAGRGPHR
jgi:hypothetical protein